MAAQADVSAPDAEYQPSPDRHAQAVDGPASTPDGARQDEAAQHGAWQGEHDGGADQGGQQEAQTAAGRGPRV
jgi:hypothetical protein